MDIEPCGRLRYQRGRDRRLFQSSHHARVCETPPPLHGCVCVNQLRGADAHHNARLHQGVPGRSEAGQVSANRHNRPFRFPDDLRFQCAVGEEFVRDVRCALANISASDVQCGVTRYEYDFTRRRPVCGVVDLRFVIRRQRDPLHRSALVRQTRTQSLPPTMSSFPSRSHGVTAACRRRHTAPGSTCFCDEVIS